MVRRAASIDFVIHLVLGLGDENFLGDFPTYSRSINRILQNGFNKERNSRWGRGDTYGHTRRMPQLAGHYGRNRRNDSQRAPNRSNRPNQYRYVNFSVVVEDVGGEDDSSDYNGEDPGNADYHGGHSQIQVYLVGAVTILP